MKTLETVSLEAHKSRVSNGKGMKTLETASLGAHYSIQYKGHPSFHQKSHRELKWR